MLNGLDQVGWARLTHAYGSAQDVPDQVRDLVSPDPVRSSAFHVVKAALRLAFPSGALPAGTGYPSLDDRQSRLVDALAGSPATWLIDGRNFGNFSMLVGEYGLPATNDALRDYAGTR